jgi:hypothetical protein
VDELLQFCTRVLLDPDLAAEAAAQARAGGAEGRLAALAAAGRACREHAPHPPASGNGGPVRGLGRTDAAGSLSLGAAVARELVAACAQLAERHRETVALRELLDLSYEQIAAVIRVEPAAVGPLLARARLRLRTALRGPIPASEQGCEVRDRALRALARRQDGEPVSDEDEDWLLAHLGACEPCERAHAAMLEASACYRAWARAAG